MFDTDCTICLSELDQNKIILQNCSHFFCKSCINSWICKIPTCPICRTYVSAIEKNKAENWNTCNFTKTFKYIYNSEGYISLNERYFFIEFVGEENTNKFLPEEEWIKILNKIHQYPTIHRIFKKMKVKFSHTLHDNQEHVNNFFKLYI